MTTPIETWNCRACGVAVSTLYCPGCGERALNPRDLTLVGLIEQIATALSSLDARLIRSLKCLITRPGFLTAAYLNGERKPYLGPFSLFLIANLFFFGVQSLTNANIFSTPLDKHLHDLFWSPIARHLVTQHLNATHATIEAYAPVFNRSVLLNAKSLIILMVLAFVALPPLLFRRSNKPIVAHAVFSLHLYTFLLLLFCVALVIAQIDVLLGGGGFESESMDHVLSVGLLLVCATYVYVASKAVYQTAGIGRVLNAAAMTLAIAVIVLGYRFVLLPITLYST